MRATSAQPARKMGLKRSLLAIILASGLASCAIVPLPHGGEGVAVSPAVPLIIGGAIVGHHFFGHRHRGYRGGRGFRRGHGYRGGRHHHRRGHRNPGRHHRGH